jgi:hypothetical protein
MKFNGWQNVLSSGPAYKADDIMPCASMVVMPHFTSTSLSFIIKKNAEENETKEIITYNPLGYYTLLPLCNSLTTYALATRDDDGKLTSVHDVYSIYDT